jgi:peptidyl-prolyl cis-trans isomerase A (cyclophilin A)
MLGAMRSSLRPSWPLVGFALALLFGGCPSDDGPAQTTGPSSSEETAEPATTTTDGGSTAAPPATTAATTTTTETTSGPATTTGVDSTSAADTTAADTMASTTAAGPPQVVMETTLGTIVIELDDQAAPVTVENFLAYVDAGFFDGSDGLGATIFHRVIPGFVIQGGGLTEALAMKATMPPIVNESGNGLVNVRGTIAMARTMQPDTATSQFFFNLVDNGFLDDPPGYAVFGAVIEGLEVVDAIAAVEVDGQDIPVEPVIILSTTLQ